MKDSTKSCFGFTALILALGLAFVSLLLGGVGELVTQLGGNSLGITFRTGLIGAFVVFGLLFLTALYFFISIRDWSWIPAILGGVYAILPDLIIGPQDDLAAMVLGVVVSGGLNYFMNRRGIPTTSDRPELPPEA